MDAVAENAEDFFDVTVGGEAGDAATQQQAHSIRRKRRKPAAKIDEYFDRIQKDDGKYFKCKILKVNGNACSQEFKGPGTSSSM